MVRLLIKEYSLINNRTIATIGMHDYHQISLVLYVIKSLAFHNHSAQNFFQLNQLNFSYLA